MKNSRCTFCKEYYSGAYLQEHLVIRPQN